MNGFNADEYVPNQIIVKMRLRTEFFGEEKQYDEESAKILAYVVDKIADNVYVIKDDNISADPDGTLARYNNCKYVDYAELNRIMRFGA